MSSRDAQRFFIGQPDQGQCNLQRYTLSYFRVCHLLAKSRELLCQLQPSNQWPICNTLIFPRTDWFREWSAPHQWRDKATVTSGRGRKTLHGGGQHVWSCSCFLAASAAWREQGRSQCGLGSRRCWTCAPCRGSVWGWSSVVGGEGKGGREAFKENCGTDSRQTWEKLSENIINCYRSRVAKTWHRGAGSSFIFFQICETNLWKAHAVFVFLVLSRFTLFFVPCVF